MPFSAALEAILGYKTDMANAIKSNATKFDIYTDDFFPVNGSGNATFDQAMCPIVLPTTAIQQATIFKSNAELEVLKEFEQQGT